MRYLHICVVAILLCAAVAYADLTHITIGDIPRTNTHFLNSTEAALARANVAVGGLNAYFYNPACASDVMGAEGEATVRYNVKNRDYLPRDLSVSEDGFNFPQAVAAKGSAQWVFGIGYSNPSHRNVEISGRYTPEGMPTESYTGKFTGDVRFFEAIAAVSIGEGGQGGFGIAAGLATLSESARETHDGSNLESANLDGSAASIALGFTYDVTEQIGIGLGYRWGTQFDVDGDWDFDDPDTLGQTGDVSGTSKTAPIGVAGVRFSPSEKYDLYLSYIHEGWDEASASVSSHSDNGGSRDEFDKPLRTIALGAEGKFSEGKYVARLGAAFQLESGIEGALIPAYSFGLGGVWNFTQYAFETAITLEQFDLNGDVSGQTTNYGFYFTVAYRL
jgi:hypothetical protein